MALPSDKSDKSLSGRTVLVTGANGGLGEQFVHQALSRGAKKVYAAARSPQDWRDQRIEPLALDITNTDDVRRAVLAASDVDLLVNNAGIAPQGESLFGSEDEMRRIFDTNFFGTLRVANAFAPILATNGGGTMLNILSSAVWVSIPTAYAASKAAMWSATNGLRFALEGQKTQVVGLHVGMVDTPMSAHYDTPKSSAVSVVAQAYDAIAAGEIEVLADAMTRDVKSRLGTKAEEFYPPLHEMLRGLLGS